MTPEEYLAKLTNTQLANHIEKNKNYYISDSGRIELLRVMEKKGLYKEFSERFECAFDVINQEYWIRISYLIESTGGTKLVDAALEFLRRTEK
jgi:hypothetical protein